MTTRKLKICTALMALIAATACGGGGSSEPPAPPPPPPGTGGGGGQTLGINGGGRWVTLGTLSTFGSVVVNGVRYGTNGAEILVNGSPATQADLRQGQVVLVEGDVAVGGATGEAVRVVYENALRGRAEQVDLVARTVTLLDQQVLVRPETIFDDDISPGQIESLSVDDDLVVSGFLDSAGRLVATRIDRDPAAGTAEVLGIVSDVDTSQQRFRINGLEVDYSAATVDGFASGAPANGDAAYVRGPTPATGAALAATQVAARPNGAPAEDDDNVDLEGFVTRYVSSADFDVAGQRVATSAATQYVASSAADLRLDVFVDVEGTLDAGGVLQAERIEVIPVANILIEAALDSVDAQAGTLGLLGVEIAANARTRYADDDDQFFSLADLRAGDGVQIAAYQRAGGLTAVRIERDDDGADDVEIEGPATDLADPEFRVGGIRIVTDSQTEFDDTSRAEFFATAAGRRVEVEGTWTGSAVLAEEVELED